MREVLKSKIHQATVTEANLSYVGSVTIDQDLLERTDLWAGQKVLVVSNTTGVRLETYVIAAPPGSGVVCINGAAAHLIKKGEQVIIIGFCLTDRPTPPQCILVDECNKFVKFI